jgi:hypothetical protein
MGFGAMIYVPSFIKIGSSIQKLIGEIQTHIQYDDLISLLLYYENNKSGLKSVVMS